MLRNAVGCDAVDFDAQVENRSQTQTRRALSVRCPEQWLWWRYESPLALARDLARDETHRRTRSRQASSGLILLQFIHQISTCCVGIGLAANGRHAGHQTSFRPDVCRVFGSRSNRPSTIGRRRGPTTTTADQATAAAQRRQPHGAGMQRSSRARSVSGWGRSLLRCGSWRRRQPG